MSKQQSIHDAEPVSNVLKFGGKAGKSDKFITSRKPQDPKHNNPSEPKKSNK